MPATARRLVSLILFGCALVGASAASVDADADGVIYSFKKRGDGREPGSLINVGGFLYGVAGGGTAGMGTVFRISSAGDEKILYSFKGGIDGAFPWNGLIDVSGTLYGTTEDGGGSGVSGLGCGTFYSVTPRGVEKVLYRFKCGADGAYPTGRLSYVGGTFYGTTTNGGEGNCHCGTVFSVTPAGVEKVLHAFQSRSDGAYPSGGLFDLGGTFYGTTAGGGGAGCNGGCGTVFSILPDGTEKVVYAFKGGTVDGYLPNGDLTGIGDTLYGTTELGGAYGRYPKSSQGTVFSVTPAGVEKVLHSFGGFPGGSRPFAGLLALHGTLYGTTTYGNAYPPSPTGTGTVFSITRTGKLKVLLSFVGLGQGANPITPLAYLRGALYGTTSYGGAYNSGTVFKVTP